MPTYVALLRGINLGSTTTLPKADLIAMFEDAGYEKVRTYIASGNVIFVSRSRPPAITREIERRMESFFGRTGRVHIRDADEMSRVVEANPFPHHNPSKVAVLFLDGKPMDKDLKNLRGLRNEVLRPGEREIYTFYPDGMGKSKLVIPAAAGGTARNMNTVAKLADLAAAL